jgi:hypothetical protein
MNIAERLKAFDAYLGTEMNLRLTRMRAEGKDVINSHINQISDCVPDQLLC